MKKATVIFRHVDFPGLREAFEALGYATVVCVGEHELLHALDDSVVLCISSMYKDIKKPFSALAVKRKLNRRGVPVISWNRDGPSNMGDKAWRIWLLQHVAFMDAYATHTLQGAGKFSGEVIYLPNAAWGRHYHLGERSLTDLRNPGDYRHSVSFFGAINPGKYPEMQRRADFLGGLGKHLTSLGIDYAFVDRQMSFAEQRDFIQRSKINLNFHAGCDTRYQGGYDGQPYSWGLPERCYGIPACGGFLLSDERGHAADDFQWGAEWVDFSSLEDCVEKIRFYLANFEATRSIAEAAYHRVMKQHLYTHRAQCLLRFLAYWRQKNTCLP